MLGVIANYLAKTAKTPPAPSPLELKMTEQPKDELDETAPDDPALDAETSEQPN